jgi:hypothetical protein
MMALDNYEVQIKKKDAEEYYLVSKAIDHIHADVAAVFQSGKSPSQHIRELYNIIIPNNFCPLLEYSDTVVVASTGNITTVSTEEISLLMENYKSESTKEEIPKGMQILWMANDVGVKIKKNAESVEGATVLDPLTPSNAPASM